jgi:hypothetical protein
MFGDPLSTQGERAGSPSKRPGSFGFLVNSKLSCARCVWLACAVGGADAVGSCALEGRACGYGTEK